MVRSTRKFHCPLVIISIISLAIGSNAKTVVAKDVSLTGSRGPPFQHHAKTVISTHQPNRTIASQSASLNAELNAKTNQTNTEEHLPNVKIDPKSKMENISVSMDATRPPAQIIRFELSDAAVPNKETAELISQGRIRVSKQEMVHSVNEQQSNNQHDMFTDESRIARNIQENTQTERSTTQSKENRKAKSINTIGYANQAYTVPRYNFDRYQSVVAGKMFIPLPKEAGYQQWWKQPIKLVNPYNKHQITISAYKPFSPSIEYSKPSVNANYENLSDQQYKYETPPSDTAKYQWQPQLNLNAFQPNSHENPTVAPFIIEIPDKKVEYSAENYLHSQTDALTQLIGKPADQQLQGLNSLLDHDHLPLKQRQQDSTAPVLFPLGARLPKPRENQTESILSRNKVLLDETQAGIPLHEPVSYALVPYYLQEDQKPIIEASMEDEESDKRVPLHNPSVQHQPPEKTILALHELNTLAKDLNHQYSSGYKFGYRVRDQNTGNDFGHTQNRDTDGVTRGEYHTLLPDGRLQTVWYTADKKGFHADVSYNGEPPTKHANG